ncbi:MAG TPA: hypothetical protein VH482_09945 [Thermomicrobiales bacterium]|jgi:hypothetical protein
MISREEREAMIQELLDRTSLPREYAEEVVAISLGESEGDVVATRPLTAEERQRIGLDITAEEALTRMRERARAEKRSAGGG